MRLNLSFVLCPGAPVALRIFTLCDGLFTPPESRKCFYKEGILGFIELGAGNNIEADSN
jgi:hypothetical protein